MANQNDQQTTDRVLGLINKLDETRLVFLGHDSAMPGTWFVGFRNAKGNDTKLCLSTEALNALMELRERYGRGERVTFPHKTVWRLVQDGECE